MKYISLFAGIGGFDYGLQRCSKTETSGCGTQSRDTQGFNVKRPELVASNEFSCCWANEWDKYAAAIYRYQFSQSSGELWEKQVRSIQTGIQQGGDSPDNQFSDGDGGRICSSSSIKRGEGWWHEPSHLFEGDIRTVDPLSIPEHDLIVGGFPCQSFSIAGKRGGFEDTRGTLFFEICRIARACRTKYLLLENVKGLFSHDSGNTFQTIIRTLDELGYDVQWDCLNSKNFGVPQNRERVFIIGHLRELARPQVFPIREISSGVTEGANAAATVGTLSAGGHSGGMHSGMTLLHTSYPGEVREYTDINPTISTPSGGGHLPMVAHCIDANYAKGDVPGSKRGRTLIHTATAVLTPNRPEKRQNGRRFKEDGEEIFTLTGQDIHGVSQGSSIRRLTPIECERLQGFPDNWTAKGIDKNDKEILISDSQRYKCCGNAVTTNVITAVGNAMASQWGTLSNQEVKE